MNRIVRLFLQVLSVGSLAGCMPSPMQSTVSSVPAIQSPAPQPAFRPAPPVVVQNPWKPDAVARKWRHIVLHHTASSAGSVESVHEAHIGRGWDGIGYHFLIGNGKGMGDGEIQPTFRWREQIHGAHAKSPNNEYNEYGIGICLVGNFEEADPSDAQLASVKRLVSVLKHEYQLTDSQVIGHREVKATACPGKNFPIGEISRSSVFPVLAGQFGTYVTEQPSAFQVVKVERSNLR